MTCSQVVGSQCAKAAGVRQRQRSPRKASKRIRADAGAGKAQEEPQYKWASHVSGERETVEECIDECAEEVAESLGGEEPDLVLCFASTKLQLGLSAVVPKLQERFPQAHVAGASGPGVVGSREAEEERVVSLAAGRFPGAEVGTFWLDYAHMPDLDAPPDRWEKATGCSREDSPSFLLFADPAFGSINDLLSGLDFAFPSSPVVGGLSGGRTLFTPWGARDMGAVGVWMKNVRLEPIVCQGCTPCSEKVYEITAHTRNIVTEVEGASGERKTPLEALKEVLAELEERDRKRAQDALMVGLSASPLASEEGQESFLVRPVLGADPPLGALALGEGVSAGQRFKFYVRDQTSAREDLAGHMVSLKRRELAASLEGAPVDHCFGALQFSCNGRGKSLYGGEEGVDLRALAEAKPVPTAGFFCAGEIGPVDSSDLASTYLHGFTSVFGLLRQPPSS